jgi:N-acetyltransferase
VRKCKKCELSYTIGAPDDEQLHKTYCASVSRGLDWTREEERDGAKANMRSIKKFISVKGHQQLGRIVAVDCAAKGKVGVKVCTMSRVSFS